MNDSGGEKICPICGYDSTKQNPENCLLIGFVLNDRYTVGQAKHSNGEGIAYIGWDNSESSVVTVREYFPSGFAVRNADKTVGMVKGGENEAFAALTKYRRHIRRKNLKDFPYLHR